MYDLTLGSLFDGSGGFPLAGILNGIIPKWASEIEPFPIRVTTKQIPQMKHLGDIAKMDGSKIEPVDIITFGSPCQNLSLAGKRSGLDGEKSSLFYEAIRIVKEMRSATNGKYPRFIVWENVPGAYSSAGGNDFRCILEEIIKIKDEAYTIPMPERPNGSIKWMHSGEIVATDCSIAWRTIDAQFWGVAQRRRRIFLVADFASECAGKILFESEGMSGYPSQSGIPWQGVTGNATACTGKTTCFEPGAIVRLETGHFWDDSACTLRAAMGDNRLAVAIENHPTDSRVKLDESEKVQTLTSRMGTGGGNVPLVMGERLQGLPITENIAQTILATDYKGAQCVCEVEPKTLKIRSGIAGGGKGALVQCNKSATLSCNNEQTVFVPKAYGICSDGSNSMKSPNPNSGIYEADTSRTLDGNACNPSANQGGIAIVETNEAYSFDTYNNKQDDVMPSIGTNCGMSTGRSICLQGSMIGRKNENGPNGDGINEEVSFTLDATDRHAVVYAIDRETFNCGQNFARNLGIDDSGIASTLNAQGPSAVAEPISFYPQMKAESQCYREDGIANTIVNGTNPGYQNGIVEPTYTVRRLTPLECCRLQGFPDFWCDGLETPNPTDEDIAFWTEVFETYRLITGTSTKPKSKSQIIKWLKNPHSDSAEYKMWGNGLCVNIVIMIMKWIKNAVESENS